jgi:hypothetical protein
LQKTYITAQENKDDWNNLDKKYNFNALFFAYHDATPWGQKFLTTIVNDPIWAPVFVDNYAIIFLKKNDLNKKIIEKYELPRNLFSISQNNNQ